MKKMRDFLVWQKAYQLTLDVYRATDSFPSEERLALTAQLRFTASTVPGCISEYCRQWRPEDASLALSNTADALQKLAYYLELSRDLGYLLKEHFEMLLEQLEAVLALLTENHGLARKELEHATADAR